MMQPQPPTNGSQQAGMRRQYIAQQQTLPQQAVFPPPLGPVPPTSSTTKFLLPVPVVAPLATPDPSTSPKKKLITRMIAVFLVIGLAGAIYVIWQTPTTTTTPTSSSANVSQQNFAATGATASTTDGIRVYVVGAVKHPGIYTLALGARVYDLIQAAGGPLPTANLVAINLAAKLSDGQEVYITQIGETPPTTTGGVPSTGNGTLGIGGGGSSNTQLVNINTASVDVLSQNLHVSKKTAQAIIDYRTQHGNYSSVDQLALVVSRSIYNKIKAQCTV